MNTGDFDYTSSTTVVTDEDPSNPEMTGRFISIYDDFGVFTADIKFYEQNESTATNVFQNIEIVSYNAPIAGITVSQFDQQTIRISGTATGVIGDNEFKFLMPDNTILTTNKIIDETYLALTSWQPPSIRMVTLQHVLEVKVKSIMFPEYYKTFTASHDVYWKLQRGISAFQEALHRGVL